MKTNTQRVPCDACGASLAPGEGRVWWCAGDDDNHFDCPEGGAPHIYCLDADACRARVAAADNEIAALRQREQQERDHCRAEVQAIRERVGALLAGLISAGACWDASLPPRSEWRKIAGAPRWPGDVDGVYLYQVADNMYVYEHGAASELIAPQQIVEDAWRAWAARFNITAKSAREWLTEYDGCAGSEMYRFISESDVSLHDPSGQPGAYPSLEGRA